MTEPTIDFNELIEKLIDTTEKYSDVCTSGATVKDAGAALDDVYAAKDALKWAIKELHADLVKSEAERDMLADAIRRMAHPWREA